MKKIIISGWYGYKNTGDEAILASMIDSIRKEINDVDITVFSANTPYTTKIHHVKAVYPLPFGVLSIGSAILRGRLFQTAKALWKAELFILGGGGFLSDWQSWTVILQWLGPIVLSKIFRKKVMLYAVGAGPITTKRGKFLTRVILNKCADVITVRDDQSKEWLQKAGVKKKIYVTVDPAILLKPAEPDRINELLKGEHIDSSKPLVGIAISPIFHIQKYWPNQYEKFLKFKNVWPKVVDFIISELDANVVFIPMQIPSDRDFALELIKSVENKVRNRVKLITGEYTPQEMLGIISRMDMMIGMRLHSLILAAGRGVPMVGIVIHHKTWCFLSEVGQENMSVGLGDGINWKNEEIEPNKLLGIISKVWVDRVEIKQKLEERMEYLRKHESVNIESLKDLLKHSDVCKREWLKMQQCFNCGKKELIDKHEICGECAANPFVVERYRIYLAEKGYSDLFIDTYKNEVFNNFPEIYSGEMYDFAIKYHQTYIDKDKTTQNRIKEISNLIPNKKDISLLDLGFGYGHLLISLNKQGYNNLAGIDISEVAVRDMKSRIPHGDFRIGHVVSLPYNDKSFDLVLATEIMEHIPVKKTFKVYNEIKCVLKQEGKLIISVPLGENLETTTFLCPHGAFVNANGHVRMYTLKVLLLELAHAGFEIDIIKYLYPYLGGKLRLVKLVLKTLRYIKPCGVIVVARKR